MEDDEFGHLYDQHGDFRDQEEYEEYAEFADPAWVRDEDDIADSVQSEPEIETDDNHGEDGTLEQPTSRHGQAMSQEHGG